MKKNFTRIFALGILLITILTSCASKITQEQLNELKRLSDEKQVLEHQSKAKEDEITRLDSELKNRKIQADSCDSKKKTVVSRIAKWPNVWGTKISSGEANPVPAPDSK